MGDVFIDGCHEFRHAGEYAPAQSVLAQRIVELIVTKYSDNYGLVVYMSDVETSRSNKF